MKISAVISGYMLTVIGIVGQTLTNPGSFMDVDRMITIAFFLGKSNYGKGILWYLMSVMLLVFGVMLIYYGMNVEDEHEL